MAGYLEFFFLADARLVDGSRRSGERTKRDTKFHGSFECCLDIKKWKPALKEQPTTLHSVLPFLDARAKMCNAENPHRP
jgi:hypothetical protein